EILDGVGLDVEPGEEPLAADARQQAGRAVEEVGEAEALERPAHELAEEAVEDGDAEVLRRALPDELPLRLVGVALRLQRLLLPVPEGPRREHPVEQRLHDGGAEEPLAALPSEVGAEGLFEGGAEGGEDGQRRAVEAAARLAGVGGEE